MAGNATDPPRVEEWGIKQRETSPKRRSKKEINVSNVSSLCGQEELFKDAFTLVFSAVFLPSKEAFFVCVSVCVSVCVHVCFVSG